LFGLSSESLVTQMRDRGVLRKHGVLKVGARLDGL